jgi:hypothetical protein
MNTSKTNSRRAVTKLCQFQNQTPIKEMSILTLTIGVLMTTRVSRTQFRLYQTPRTMTKPTQLYQIRRTMTKLIQKTLMISNQTTPQNGGNTTKVNGRLKDLPKWTEKSSRIVFGILSTTHL